MGELPTTDDILSDIEFELLQGIVAQDELGWGIWSVEQHQNTVRRETMAKRRGPGGRELANLQFQINDMLLTLLQVTAEKIRILQLELDRTQALLRLKRLDGQAEMEAASTGTTPDGSPPPDDDLEETLYSWSPAEITGVLNPEWLLVEPDVRVSQLPIVGPLITQLRRALHSIPLLYVGRLGRKQVEINARYGKWLLHLLQVQQRQHTQLQALSEQLTSLQEQLAQDMGGS
jgi:hypothetical protein